ncbi:hypothetical protein [Aureivirga sp. CE67]|uniref:hypothetical protein n=1 Tax=Aureivirga sp. CE67 TaxID=1788983 RepID=UPI0018C91591|nr:hypothetical protein [Aureivirga sp. CE67]
MKKIILILVIAFSSSQVFPQADYDKIVNDFFETYKTDKDKAFDKIFETNKWLSENKKGKISVKTTIHHDVLQLGEYFGYEEMITTKLGKSLVLKSFILKYERQPIRFTFIFYKANDHWILYDFNYDDNLNNEIFDKARDEFLNPNKK